MIHEFSRTELLIGENGLKRLSEAATNLTIPALPTRELRFGVGAGLPWRLRLQPGILS